jgi:hypothetical protein
MNHQSKCTVVHFDFCESLPSDPDLVKRAAELIKATECLSRAERRINGYDWLSILTDAIDTAFAGLPQMWAAWVTGGDYHLRTPDAAVVFQPKELGRRDGWIKKSLGRYELVLFLIDLEGEGIPIRYPPPIRIRSVKSRAREKTTKRAISSPMRKPKTKRAAQHELEPALLADAVDDRAGDEEPGSRQNCPQP